MTKTELTAHELRILQILANNFGRQKRLEISQAMSRVTAEDRNQALTSLEGLELINSAEVPRTHGGKPGGVPGVVYWLTPAGVTHVKELRKQGQIKAKRGAA